MGKTVSRSSLDDLVTQEDNNKRGLLPCFRPTRIPAVKRADVDTSHPLSSKIASSKKLSDGSRQPPYDQLVSDAELHVPSDVAQQIRVDIPRTFGALPNGRIGSWGWETFPAAESEAVAQKEREALLTRVLLSHEWRSMEKSVSSRDDSESCTYVQGVNLLAAMCLGFTGRREEDTFWLLQHLVEDVLGRGFFAKSPPLQKFHGDKTAAASLVSTEALRVTEILGPQVLAEAVSMLAARFFLSGFVGCLSPGPLLAFWEELLSKNCTSYPRIPLLKWFVGLICHAEEDLIEIAQNFSVAEIGPLFFRKVQETGRMLPESWRPSVDISPTRVEELKQISMDASKKYIDIHAAQQARDLHAKNTLEVLDRSSRKFSDLLQSTQSLPSSPR